MLSADRLQRLEAMRGWTWNFLDDKWERAFQELSRYCETHGLATMMITMPPMVSPTYVRVQSLGMDERECIFELTTVPADDMERILMVQEKVFGPVE